MQTGEIISLVAIIISFIGVVSSFIFSYKKADKERDAERELNIKTITNIKDNLQSIDKVVNKIDLKIEAINENVNEIDRKIVEHDTKIKSLEHEIYKNRKDWELWIGQKLELKFF